MKSQNLGLTLVKAGGLMRTPEMQSGDVTENHTNCHECPRPVRLEPSAGLLACNLRSPSPASGQHSHNIAKVSSCIESELCANLLHSHERAHHKSASKYWRLGRLVAPVYGAGSPGQLAENLFEHINL